MYNTTKIFSLLLLITIFFCFEKLSAQTTSDNNPDFQLTTEGICVCTDAGIGETGTFFTGTANEITYTKRTRAELNTLIFNDENGPEIALTCTSGITDMSNLFHFKTSFNQDISSWDTSNVIKMNSMFSFAFTFNQPLNNWDVSNVTDMSSMFSFADAFNQNIGDWDISNVTNMVFMFNNANSFNQPLNNWDVSNVTDMGYMFNSADAFNQPLNNWDVSNVTYMQEMFAIASSFNQDISNWCVENIASEPSNFSQNSPLQASFKPNWGAPCPSDFYEENGICKCENANFGDTGIVNIGGVDKTFTKRTRAELDTLINNDQADPEIALTCTSGITDMSYLFYLKTQFNQDISSWDVSNVTNMSNMFYTAISFNQPLNNWDVSNVTDMQAMFEYANVFAQSLNNWDVSNVTNMQGMFENANFFNQPLNDWDVSNVTNMQGMFENATFFNQPLNDWDVSNVTNMQEMFENANFFNQPLNDWDVSNVTNMQGMFRDVFSFNQDISNWCVENIASEPSNFSQNSPLQASFKPNWGAPCPSDFYEENGICKCENANFGDTGIVNIGGVDKTFTKRTRAQLDALIANSQTNPQIALTCTSGITDMSDLFLFASSTNPDISSWDVSNVTNMSSMFEFAVNFNQLLNNWDVSNVTNMQEMFDNAFSFNQPLNDWDVSNVTNMSIMFDSAIAFNQPLNDWDVSNVTNMQGMFESAFSFNQPLNDWDVSNVTNMQEMFENANFFNQPLNDWDVSNVTNMQGMFRDVFSFNQDISNWCVENIASEPSNFSQNSPLQASFNPLWGEPCTTNTWTGIADSNWSNTTNWSMNALPVPADNVSIRSDAPFMPEVNTSTTAEVNNLIALDGSMLDVYGVLKVNNRLHNNGNLNFKSNATATGQLDEFTGNLSGKGGILVERHIPQSNRAFRYIGSSVNTTESINSNLQEGATTTSTEPNPHPGYGTHITGGASANGFDTTQTNNPSMFEWDVDTQTWQAVTQTLPKPINVGEAYALMIRGDRSTDLSSNESFGPATTLRFRGNIQTGDFSVDSGDLAQTVNEFSLLVNPYQSKVNMKTLLESADASGLDSQTIYVYDPTLGSRGGYATIDLSLADPSSTPYDGISGTTNADENLLPNQAFFIKTTASNPSLTFKETYKNTTGTFTDTFSEEEELSVIHVNLKRQSDSSLTDGVTLRFNSTWSNAVDDHDASKFWNYDERVALFNTNAYLAIEKRALPQDNEMTQLYTANYIETDYLWQINLQNINREVFLYDAYLDTETPLQQNAITDVTFSTDAGLSESIDPLRFTIKFGSETLSQNQAELSQLSVYPNPVTDYKFRITGTELQKNTEIKLIDVLGRCVFKTEKDISNENGISIDSNLQAGVYQLIISQGSTSYHTKLVIKN